MTIEEAHRHLNALLAMLDHYEHELAEAEREDLQFVAESCRREIRARQDLIRRHCDLTGLPVPPGVLKSSDMSRNPHSETKLRDLLSKLFEYRHELEAAEIRGDEVIARGARHMIRMQHGVIRNHCRSMGLPIPPDVPPKD